MTTILSESRFFSVEARNGLYRQQAEHERIIADSETATICFDLADIILQGVDLYGGINSLDEDWRMMIYKKECPYEASLANRILKLYAGWLDTSENVVALHGKFEAEYTRRGFDRDRVSQIQTAIREVRGILTSDDRFFIDEKLVKLRDAAISDHRSGQCIDV